MTRKQIALDRLQQALDRLPQQQRTGPLAEAIEDAVIILSAPEHSALTALREVIEFSKGRGGVSMSKGSRMPLLPRRVSNWLEAKLAEGDTKE